MTRQCSKADGYLAAPNGDTPLPNGHLFISTIQDHKLHELDANWQQVFTMSLPVSYPSDPQPTRAGNILVADYSNAGKIVEVARDGHVVWQWAFTDPVRKLNKPSLAIELPNGNILANDDLNHRVIVINKQTNQIVWQYGVTGKPGNQPGQLNVPDGMDIIMRPTPPVAAPAQTDRVGYAMSHRTTLQGTMVRLKAYLLAQAKGYAIVSDESSGAIGPNDLPVTGDDITLLAPNHAYLLTGRLVAGGVAASNGNTYHLELTAAPVPAP